MSWEDRFFYKRTRALKPKRLRLIQPNCFSGDIITMMAAIRNRAREELVEQERSGSSYESPVILGDGSDSESTDDESLKMPITRRKNNGANLRSNSKESNQQDHLTSEPELHAEECASASTKSASTKHKIDNTAPISRKSTKAIVKVKWVEKQEKAQPESKHSSRVGKDVSTQKPPSADWNIGKTSNNYVTTTKDSCRSKDNGLHQTDKILYATFAYASSGATTAESKHESLTSSEAFSHSETPEQRLKGRVIKSSSLKSIVERSSKISNTSENSLLLPIEGHVRLTDMITELTRSGSEFGDIKVFKVKLCHALAQVSISKLCNFVPDSLQEDLKAALRFCKINVIATAPEAASTLANMFLIFEKAVVARVSNGYSAYDAVEVLSSIHPAMKELWKCGVKAKRNVLEHHCRDQSLANSGAISIGKIHLSNRNRDSTLATATIVDGFDKNDHNLRINERGVPQVSTSNEKEKFDPLQEVIIPNGVAAEGSPQKKRRMTDAQEEEQIITGCMLESMITNGIKSILLDPNSQHNDKVIAGSVYRILKGPRSDKRVLARTFIIDLFRKESSDELSVPSASSFDARSFVFSIAYVCRVFDNGISPPSDLTNQAALVDDSNNRHVIGSSSDNNSMMDTTVPKNRGPFFSA